LLPGTAWRIPRLCPYLAANRVRKSAVPGIKDHQPSAPKHHDGKIIMMRTTINLPDDVAEIIRSFADVRGISLGQAVADLVLKGLQPRVPVGSSVFPQFEIAEGAAPISLEQTLAADDEV